MLYLLAAVSGIPLHYLIPRHSLEASHLIFWWLFISPEHLIRIWLWGLKTPSWTWFILAIHAWCFLPSSIITCTWRVGFRAWILNDLDFYLLMIMNGGLSEFLIVFFLNPLIGVVGDFGELIAPFILLRGYVGILQGTWKYLNPPSIWWSYKRVIIGINVKCAWQWISLAFWIALWALGGHVLWSSLHRFWVIGSAGTYLQFMMELFSLMFSLMVRCLLLWRWFLDGWWAHFLITCSNAMVFCVTDGVAVRSWCSTFTTMLIFLIRVDSLWGILPRCIASCMGSPLPCCIRRHGFM